MPRRPDEVPVRLTYVAGFNVLHFRASDKLTSTYLQLQRDGRLVSTRGRKRSANTDTSYTTADGL